MKNFTGYELIWLFMIYSFLGWVLETVTAAIRQKRFVNRGLVNGPLCVIYGAAAVMISVGLQELTGIWLFLFAAVYATVVEWIGGHLIEKIWHERWWSYEKIKWNLDGYICLPVSVFWGLLGYAAVRWGNPLLLRAYAWLPQLAAKISVWTVVVLLALDVLADLVLLQGTSKRLEQWAEANSRFANLSARMGKWIALRVEERIYRAYPKATRKEVKPKEIGVFAAGCSFYKIVLLFFIGAFLGDITETIFCRITAGVWMSRSSVIWGPFSIVWGLAIAAATALLYRYRERSDTFLFWMGTFLGGAYEYLCSVFTEMVFGKVFWDYSKIPFNLGGRINLLYCFFWGMAAVVWLKKLYPVFSHLIERLGMRSGKILTWALIVFMCCNMVASSMALTRYQQREQGIAAEAPWQEWMDAHYDDAKMQKIYPNAVSVVP